MKASANPNWRLEQWEGVNLALADAVALAEALTEGKGWEAISAHEAPMAERAQPEAEGSIEGLNGTFPLQVPVPSWSTTASVPPLDRT